MANTYSQIYVHLIFVVSGRQSFISYQWKEDLYKYIAGIIHNKNQKLIIVNGIANHIHLLVNTKPDCCISDLIRDIKSNTTKFINENNWAMGKFKWQSGSGVFSVSQSQLDIVANYIIKQEEHHKTRLFKDEFIEFLEAYKIEYNEKYLFDEE